MASNYARDVAIKWHFLDLSGHRIGKIAARLAPILMGKTKPTYSPHLDLGDHVVVINARKGVFTGRKYELTEYVWHTGYRRKTKTPKYVSEIKNNPEFIIKHAVRGMLPKNMLQDKRMKKLHVFPDAEHPFKKLKFDSIIDPPKRLDIRNLLR